MPLPKQLYLRTIQTAVSFAIVYYLLGLVDWPRVAGLSASGVLPSLWPGPPLLLLGLAAAAGRWRALLAFFGLHLSRRDAFAQYLIGTFYSVLLPGVLGGDVVRAALCRAKTHGAATLVLASVGLERGFGLWGASLLGAAGSLFILPGKPGSFGPLTLGAMPLMAVGVPLAALAVLHMGQKLVPAGTGFFSRFLRAAAQLARQVETLPPRLALRTLLLSLAFQASEILVYFYFGQALNLEVPLFFYFFAIPLVYLATVLPVSLGGVGVREGVLVWLLSLYGIPASEAVLLSFLVYFNRILLGGAGGILQAIYRIR